MATQTFFITKSNSSGGAVPRRCIYFSDTKYVANIFALRVHQFAHSGQPRILPAFAPSGLQPIALGFARFDPTPPLRVLRPTRWHQQSHTGHLLPGLWRSPGTAQADARRTR